MTLDGKPLPAGVAQHLFVTWSTTRRRCLWPGGRRAPCAAECRRRWPTGRRPARHPGGRAFVTAVVLWVTDDAAREKPPVSQEPANPDRARRQVRERPVAASRSPFADLADFVALPGSAGSRCRPTGRRLAVSVQTLDAEKKKWQSALWEVDPGGRAGGPPADPQRARVSPRPAWAPDGSLLFTSARPDPGREGGRRPEAGAVEPAGRRRRGPPGR